MNNLIFVENQILNNDNIVFILDIYDKFKKGDKLILYYNLELLFIDNDYNKIKKILKPILEETITKYTKYLYKIGFYNKENYNNTIKDYKLFFFEIGLSGEKCEKNTVYMLDNKCYTVLNYIFCLDNMFITFLNKQNYYNTGDLIMFPCGWSFNYKVESNKRYIFGNLFS